MGDLQCKNREWIPILQKKTHTLFTISSTESKFRSYTLNWKQALKVPSQHDPSRSLLLKLNSWSGTKQLLLKLRMLHPWNGWKWPRGFARWVGWKWDRQTWVLKKKHWNQKCWNRGRYSTTPSKCTKKKKKSLKFLMHLLYFIPPN